MPVQSHFEIVIDPAYAELLLSAIANVTHKLHGIAVHFLGTMLGCYKPLIERITGCYIPLIEFTNTITSCFPDWEKAKSLVFVNLPVLKMAKHWVLDLLKLKGLTLTCFDTNIINRPLTFHTINDSICDNCARVGLENYTLFGKHCPKCGVSSAGYRWITGIAGWAQNDLRSGNSAHLPNSEAWHKEKGTVPYGPIIELKDQ